MGEGRSFLADASGYRRNIPLYFIFQALIGLYLWMPIWLIFFQQRGLNLSHAGFLDAVAWVLVALLEVPTGAVADRYGRRISLAVGAVLYGLSMLAVLAEMLSPLFLFGYFGWMLANCFFSGADTALLYDTLAALGRTADYQRLLGRASAVALTSQAMGSLVGGLLAGYDMRLCFAVTAVLGLLAAGVGLAFREPPVHTEEGGVSGTGYWALIREAVRLVWTRPGLLHLLTFAAVSPVFVWLLTYTISQPYAVMVDLPLLLLGSLFMVSRLAGALGALLTRWVSGRISVRALMTVWVAVFAAGQVTLALFPSQPAMLLVAVLVLLYNAVAPVLSDLINRGVPSAQRATVGSLQSLLYRGLLAVVEPVVLAVAEGGLLVAVGLMAGLFTAMAVPVLRAWLRSGPVGGLSPVPVPTPAGKSAG